MRNCVECGAPFDPPQDNSTTCTRKCYQRWYQRERNKRRYRKTDAEPQRAPALNAAEPLAVIRKINERMGDRPSTHRADALRRLRRS